MPLEDHDRQTTRRKRQHENIIGEATLSKLLPKGYTLLTVIVAGSVYAGFAYKDILANSDNILKIQSTQEQARPRVRHLETNQAVIQQQLKGISAEQKRSEEQRKSDVEDSQRDRREILDAIKDLKK